MKITDAARTRHIYIAGKSQSGKSTLIHWMALQDITQGKGVCIIDPHGDLVNKLIHFIPKKRADDTIFFDATSPIPIDFFAIENERERDTLADDILVTFKRFSEGWGERMESILRYTIYTLLSVPGTTFLDIYHILADEQFRERIVHKCGDSTLRQYWEKQFKYLPKDSTTPILSRMSKFLLTPSLKVILGTSNPKLRIRDVMEQKKVLLVNLSKVGQDSGDLLGSLLVSKIQQSAMRRQHQHPKDRIPFYLYIDEFQHFQTSAFDVILSEAGKYKLCLTMAHQFIDQLDPKVRSSILGNASTFILFRLNERDAAHFKGEIPPMKTEKVYKRSHESGEMEWSDRPVSFEPSTLTSLPTGTCLYRASDGSAKIIRTPAPPKPLKESHAEYIRKRTIELYSCAPLVDALISKDEEIAPTTRPKRPYGKSVRIPPRSIAASG